MALDLQSVDYGSMDHAHFDFGSLIVQVEFLKASRHDVTHRTGEHVVR